MRFSTSVRSRKKLFNTVLVMSCASLNCGIGSGAGRPFVGEIWSMKRPRSASRHLRHQSTSPPAQIGRWLRGPKTRIGLWISGITYLLLRITSDEDWLDEDRFDEDWFDEQGDNDFEDWTRAPWQGPPS